MKLKVPHPAYLDLHGGGHEEYYFVCPGCKADHRIVVKWGEKSVQIRKNIPTWIFNGDLEKPTFQPSYLLKWVERDNKEQVCHSYITDGNIQFLDDCTHNLAGKTVPLEDV